jgi:DNA recombination protein RmuC
MDTTLIVVLVALVAVIAGFLIGRALTAARCKLKLNELLAAEQQATTRALQQLEKNAALAEQASAQALRDEQRVAAELAALRESLEQARAILTSQQEQIGQAREQQTSLAALEQRLRHEQGTLAGLREELSSAKATIAELNKSIEKDREALGNERKLLDESGAALKQEFQNIANKIFEEKQQVFTRQSSEGLNTVFDSFRKQMFEFKTKVEDIHLKDTEQQAILKTELAQLKELNRQMTDEAHSLATALKGSSKMQGNWGELILENVLDRSGLRIDVDYRREVSFDTETGRQRPDVVVYLPDNKHLVVDSKVSMNAYTRFVNAIEDGERAQALKEHVAAIASRIKELADRNYFQIEGLNSPEMVFMFIPIESAFVEALKADEALFSKAIEQNVLVATPTTLLTSLNIVRQLWRFEEQNENTAELARRAARIYKKLNTFLEEMDKLGRTLDTARKGYGETMKLLYSGKDNLIKQASEFERLGVSVQKSLPEHLVRKARMELDHVPDDEVEGAQDGVADDPS